MKKYIVIVLTILLIPFTAYSVNIQEFLEGKTTPDTAYSENMNHIKCDFQENDKALVGSILQKEAVYKNDKTKGILCYKNYNVFIPIKKGKADGTVKRYFESGALWRETPYKNGKQEGIEKWYHENGALWVKIPYKNGKKEGISKWYYESGALEEEAPYKNGKAEGIAKTYYESGALHKEIPYKNDKQEGIEKEYYESGALEREKHYKNGKKEGIEKKYNENGSLWGIVTYANNKAVSGKCANGRKWTNAELHNFSKGLKVDCGR